MVDQLTEAYADFLQGSYDCPDRIVLTAYHRVASSAGGFRYWWRRLYETDENLDKAHLIRLSGRFHRRVKAYAAKHDIPVLEGLLDERKHELAEQYKPDDPAFVGLFLIIISRASGVVWDVKQTSDGRTHSLTKHYRAINHIFFHVMDPQWGHVTIRISSHPPFAAMVILNGHEYLARQAHQAGRALELTSNCFTGIMSAADLTWLAETSGALPRKGQLEQVCQRWLYSCLHFALPETERLRSGFEYRYSLFQVEYSRNLLFRCPAQMEQIFEALIDRTRSRLDLRQIMTIFGRKRRPHFKGSPKGRRLRLERNLERPEYNLTIFRLHFGPLTLKLYIKGEAVLRAEVMLHNARAWSGPRRLDQFPDLIRQFHQILERFLNQLYALDQAFVADDTLDTLSQRGQVGSTPTAGLDLNQPRLRAVLQAVLALAVTPGGFNASQLAQKVRELLGWNESQYQPRHASYDLKKLRGKNWVHKIDHSRRYEPVTSGLKIMAALLTLREKVIKPVLASVTKPKSEPNPQPRTDLDLQYGKVQTEMRTLLLMLGVAV
jgi:DNA-binding transcriptional ArsR family regulator